MTIPQLYTFKTPNPEISSHLGLPVEFQAIAEDEPSARKAAMRARWGNRRKSSPVPHSSGAGLILISVVDLDEAIDQLKAEG